MRTKNTNTPAKVENIENTNTNNAATVEVVAVPESMDRTPVPTEEKVAITKEYKPTIKESAKVVENPAAPDWAADVPGVCTWQSKIIDANSSGQTLFTVTVETDRNIYNFINATSTVIKSTFGLVTVQRSGAMKVTAKTEEELQKEVESTYYKGMELLAAALKQFNRYEEVYSIPSLLHSVNGSTSFDYVRERLLECATLKNEETKERIAKAKEEREKKEAERKAAADLKAAKEADKVLAASVVGMDEWQKRMTAATAANDYAAIAALLAEKQNSEKAA